MEARGYQRGSRTTLRELKINSRDIAAMVLVLLFVGSIFFLTGGFE
jgi:energy-coupling factor transporter transmembrane protein EcfT